MTEDDQPPRQREKKARQRQPAFQVDSSVRLTLDFDLAVALGEFIVSNGSDNPAIMALGHQLKDLGD